MPNFMKISLNCLKTLNMNKLSNLLYDLKNNLDELNEFIANNELIELNNNDNIKSLEYINEQLKKINKKFGLLK